MTRYTFLLHAAEAPEFLEHLRELGVVDITTLASWQGTEEQEERIAKSKRYLKVSKAMSSFKGEGEKFQTNQEAVSAWEESTQRTSDLHAMIAKAEEELKDLEIWGDFDRKKIAQLQENGIELHFFVTAAKRFFAPWEQMFAMQVVEKRDSKVYFVIACNKGEKIEGIDATEVRAPEMTYLEKQSEIESYIAEQKEIQVTLHRAALSKDDIKKESLEQSDIYNFDHTLGSAEDAVEGHIKIFEGWSEKTLTEDVVAFAEKENVIFFNEDAKIENNPPIKLKNNFFARAFEPIGKLYMEPAYNELDLTPFFAPFFMIFFGMCLGDAGYGLLFIAAIIAFWKKIPENMKGLGWLGIFLAFAGVVFGFLGGNIFGIELVKIDAFSNIKQYMLLSDPIKSFYFSIILGVAQVLFGQILRIFNRIKREGGFIYGVSSMGWCLFFISSMVAYGADVAGWHGDVIGIHSLAYEIVLIFSWILILFFANPRKNIFVSFGSGLYSVYEMATGVIGDLISYVRLFAIGLAGAIIAQVFNELAIGLSGDIIIVKQIIMLVILVIGHGLNIFVSSLGAFVHPVRLTFVEFYKNAEFKGGGRCFNPFRKAAANN